MRAALRRITLGSSATLAAVMLLAQAAVAQDAGTVTDYRLPDPKQSSAPRVQGPVDPENPYGTPSRAPQPERTPAPKPTASPSPRISIPAPSREEQRPAARASATRPAPRASASAAAPASAAPSPTATAPEPRPERTPPPPVAPSPAPVATDEAPLVLPPTPTAANGDRTWWIVAGVALIAVAGGALLLLRRRRPAPIDNSYEIEPAPPAAEPVPQRPRPATPPPSPLPTPPGAAPRSEASTREPFAVTIDFRPQAIRLSLVYATLQYEMAVTNTGAETLPNLIVRGDLSSAHASIPVEQQLAPPIEALELKHELAPLAAGETATAKGEVRVPIQQIRPLVKGSASFLVPLARFCLSQPDGSFVRRVFTAGPRDAESGAIASVRLDAGPRNLRELGAREIEAARGFALDPVAAHG
ncbi:hypothetical protein [Novosphingobium sp. 9U]|uniref:hypothetical protein n=1 Tax=Novosphingobium sp. 9U TaxID=2653158 RepID=UPI0012F0A33A|nr:hypothetical protein [Novosphingobium sp. 9U]VWX46891.1 conserved exported hypothetical protein [Novosphingobium sp. 9U]